MFLSWKDEAREQEFRDRTRVVTATVDSTWDGGDLVPVRYRDPSGGAERKAIVDFGPDRPRRDASTVRIRVGGGATPETGPEPYGDSERWPALVQFVIPAVIGSALWWAARHRSHRRSLRLVAEPGPAYRMTAVPLPGRVFGRRWRLALHDLDARPGDQAVCVVPVIGQPVRTGPRTVEVKGRPRPGGDVVVRELAGRLWWPSGRALVGARSTFRPTKGVGPAPVDRERGRVAKGAWVIVGVTVVLFAASIGLSDDPDAASGRSVTRSATVVDGTYSTGPATIAFEWHGRRRVAQVRLEGAKEKGSKVTVRVDPADPDRVWQDGATVPERNDPPWVSAIFVAFLGFAVAAVIAVRTPSPRLDRRLSDLGDDVLRAGGFALVDGRLWYDPRTGGTGPRSGGDTRLCFDPGGLVIVDSESVSTWSWERHVHRDRSGWHWFASVEGRTLSLVGPAGLVTFDGPDIERVVDLIERIATSPEVQGQLADLDWLEGLIAEMGASPPRTGPTGPTLPEDGPDSPDATS
ncbi:MAG: hypothetical protein KDB02_12155 [Acidimicrobiales bacterium]|nr:hypothetical protein [Acidimicrobiales bacterium]